MSLRIGMRVIMVRGPLDYLYATILTEYETEDRVQGAEGALLCSGQGATYDIFGDLQDQGSCRTCRQNIWEATQACGLFLLKVEHPHFWSKGCLRVQKMKNENPKKKSSKGCLRDQKMKNEKPKKNGLRDAYAILERATPTQKNRLRDTRFWNLYEQHDPTYLLGIS